MGFKDILVALDTAGAARGRVELAAALAERFDAHLIGLYTTPPVDAPPRRGYFDYFDRSLLDPLYREYRQKTQADGAATRALFEEIAGRRALSAEWRSAAGYPSETA